MKKNGAKPLMFFVLYAPPIGITEQQRGNPKGGLILLCTNGSSLLEDVEAHNHILRGDKKTLSKLLKALREFFKNREINYSIKAIISPFSILSPCFAHTCKILPEIEGLTNSIP